jgi:hypothetical protein
MSTVHRVSQDHTAFQTAHDYPLGHVSSTGKSSSDSEHKYPLEHIDPVLAIPAGRRNFEQSSAGLIEGGVSAVHI